MTARTALASMMGALLITASGGDASDGTVGPQGWWVVGGDAGLSGEAWGGSDDEDDEDDYDDEEFEGEEQTYAVLLVGEPPTLAFVDYFHATEEGIACELGWEASVDGAASGCDGCEAAYVLRIGAEEYREGPDCDAVTVSATWQVGWAGEQAFLDSGEGWNLEGEVWLDEDGRLLEFWL